jgi:GT2 family glycosyltransferase
MELDLSIIVVTYNCEAYISRFLNELTTSLKSYEEYEILLNDNDSTDNTYNICQSFQQSANGKLIVSKTGNIGFARSNNLLIKKAAYKNILLLNPDVFDFYEAFWQNLFTIWDGVNPMVIELLNTDQTIQDNVVEELSIKSELKRLLKLKMQSAYTINHDAPIVEIECGIMAFFLLTKESAEKVGYISEKYHMFSEDRDFCFKIRRSGYSLNYSPAIRLTHIGGASSNEKWNRREVLMIKNQSDRTFIQENYTGVQRAALLFTNSLRKFIYLLKSRPVKK